MSEKPVMYVAYCKERLRDGIEECTRLFTSKEDALVWIDKIANGFAGSNCEFALFELGKRINITERVEETPQPSVKKRRFS